MLLGFDISSILFHFWTHLKRKKRHFINHSFVTCQVLIVLSLMSLVVRINNVDGGVWGQCYELLCSCAQCFDGSQETTFYWTFNQILRGKLLQIMWTNYLIFIYFGLKIIFLGTMDTVLAQIHSCSFNWYFCQGVCFCISLPLGELPLVFLKQCDLFTL